MERWKSNLYILWISQLIAMMSFSLGMPFIPYFIQELGIVEPDKIKLYTALSAAVVGIAANYIDIKTIFLFIGIGAALCGVVGFMNKGLREIY